MSGSGARGDRTVLDAVRPDGENAGVLIARPTLERIVAGEVTLQFRRWRRPTVRAGGTLRTAVGVLAVEAVDPVSLASVTVADARAAGFASRRELVTSLGGRVGTLYRIDLRHVGDDARSHLRTQDRLSEADVASLAQTLDVMDRRSRYGPWSGETLDAIARRPATSARALADDLGRERLPFKRDVRRLKELGLTESLDRGYRLSARGEAFLRARP